MHVSRPHIPELCTEFSTAQQTAQRSTPDHDGCTGGPWSSHGLDGSQCTLAIAIRASHGDPAQRHEERLGQPAVSAGSAHTSAQHRGACCSAAVDQRLDRHCGRRQLLSRGVAATRHPTNPHRGSQRSGAGQHRWGSGDGGQPGREERSRRAFGFKRGGSHCHAGERDEPRGAGGQRC